MRFRPFCVGLIFLHQFWSLHLRSSSGETPEQWIQQNLPEIVSLYRHFHRTPELSFQEVKTSARLATELRKVGSEVTEQVGGTGIVAIIKNGAGPTLLLRADMDALPILEQTGLDYASKVKSKNDRGVSVGVMHACGHDIHMSNLVGVAQYLAKNRNLWQGTLVMIGQPAEERGAGAKAMLQAGLLTQFPRPDYALALHVDPLLETGQVGYRSGYSLANVDSVDITIRGRGGHGAFPHATIDPVVIAARLVIDLQTIVSREIKPIEPAVVTVGSIHGGTKHNVIGNECHLQLTVRSYSESVRKHLHEAIRRKAIAAASSAAAPDPQVTISEGTPSLWNDPELSERMANRFKQILGKENVIESEPSMAGEDFGRYGKAGVPIMMFRLGVIDKERMTKLTQSGSMPLSLHSPLFYPDPEKTLATGIKVMSAAVLDLLGAAEELEK